MKIPKENRKEEKIQEEYYKKTGVQYDDLHLHNDDAHFNALNQIITLGKELGIQTYLDVGCGTGRGVAFLLKNSFNAYGVELSQSLLRQAIQKNDVPAHRLLYGNGLSLPFKENSFDAVCAFGLLHHIKHPNLVVKEMMRVARKVIFLSDSNRFGQGNLFSKNCKIFLWKCGLWGIANFVKTKGKNYILTEGDGVSFSYSVYDSYSLLKSWAKQLIEIPTDNSTQKNSENYLLTASHLLLVAVKK